MNMTLKRRCSLSGWLPGIAIMMAALVVVAAMATGTVQGRADNFTDIFYTNSFRGAFEWIKKLDWVGMIVQAVISIFSLFGVALLTIRIMTSMLFLSAKGMWEEVHDLKSGGETLEKDFLGMGGMVKSWASGKAGTGLDAIVGAVLLLLPDVKRYSDFGEKAGGDFGEDITITQYILKIALPTVMTVFFFAMGFNGTLFQALAVTVDFMGTFADKAISVNYAGMAEDLINAGTGYKFAFSADGTNLGKFQQNLAKDVYGRCVSKTRGASAAQLETIGKNIESKIAEKITLDNLATAQHPTEKVKAGLQAEDGTADRYVSYLGYELIVNSSEKVNGELDSWSMDELVGLGDGSNMAATAQSTPQFIHLFIRQTSDFNGAYINVDG